MSVVGLVLLAGCGSETGKNSAGADAAALCESLNEQVGTLLRSVEDAADRTCQVDRDCTTTLITTLCGTGCYHPGVSKAGLPELLSEAQTQTADVCTEIASRGCSNPSPSCIASDEHGVCLQGSCVNAASASVDPSGVATIFSLPTHALSIVHLGVSIRLILETIENTSRFGTPVLSSDALMITGTPNDSPDGGQPEIIYELRAVKAGDVRITIPLLDGKASDVQTVDVRIVSP